MARTPPTTMPAIAPAESFVDFCDGGDIELMHVVELGGHIVTIFEGTSPSG